MKRWTHLPKKDRAATIMALRRFAQKSRSGFFSPEQLDHVQAAVSFLNRLEICAEVDGADLADSLDLDLDSGPWADENGEKPRKRVA